MPCGVRFRDNHTKHRRQACIKLILCTLKKSVSSSVHRLGPGKHVQWQADLQVWRKPGAARTKAAE